MKSKIFFGVGFTLVGMSIIMQAMGISLRFSWFGILLLIFLPAMAITSLINKEWGGVFFPIALLLVIFGETLGFGVINLWQAFFAALFLSIGFAILFPKKRNKFHYHKHYYSNQSERIDVDSDDEIYWSAKLSENTRFIRSKNFTKGEFQCSMGSLNIYLDQAQINPNGATIDLQCNLGNIILILPRNCRVENNISSSLGEVGVDYPSYIDVSGPLIVITGNVSLGNVTISFK